MKTFRIVKSFRCIRRKVFIKRKLFMVIWTVACRRLRTLRYTTSLTADGMPTGTVIQPLKSPAK